MHRGLQRDFALLVCPALRGIVQLAEINKLAPTPRTVAFAPEYVVSRVRRRLRGVLVVHHGDLVVSCLTPSGQLCARQVRPIT